MGMGVFSGTNETARRVGRAGEGRALVAKWEPGPQV